jgi:hypothetical protein
MVARTPSPWIASSHGGGSPGVECVLWVEELKSVTRVQPSFSCCMEVQHHATNPLWSGYTSKGKWKCCKSEIQRRRGAHYTVYYIHMSFHTQQVRCDMSYGLEMCSSFKAGTARGGYAEFSVLSVVIEVTSCVQFHFNNTRTWFALSLNRMQREGDV